MSSEIIVNSTGRETRVALVENGTLAELHIDRGRDRGFVGNVYKGRVVRVLPGMQAAFVDVGLERAAFLYVGDIFPEFLDLPNGGPSSPEETVAEETPRAAPRAGQPAIQDLLTEGQEIVVQIAKDPIGTKGARLTTHVTLPGRYIVFMPTVEHVGISRRIDKDRERRRLREFVDRHRPKGAGFIVRTVCANQPESVLKQDMDYLLRTWDKIQELAQTKKAPALMHADHSLVVRFLRDNLTDDVQRVVVDSRPVFDELLEFMGSFMPDVKERVHLYRGKEPVFDVYGVETEIARSLGRKVWLKSGGYLVIDQTEALTAIDINSGKFVGSSSLEETTTKINLEAAKEIVYQLRLRNIGGIIIIDFIDMDQEANRHRVFSELTEALKRDRAKTNILKISELGLVEMTRKRVRESLARSMSEPCFYCDGTGLLKSRTTVCHQIYRSMVTEAEAMADDEKAVRIALHPRVAETLGKEERAMLAELEARLDLRLSLDPRPDFHLEHFEFSGGE